MSIRNIRWLVLLVPLVLLAACSTGGTPPGGTGNLQIAIQGLPGGTSANVSVSGPNGYSKAVTANVILNKLTVGSYTVKAESVTAGGATYAPNQSTQSVSVTANQTAQVTVTYSTSGGGGGGQGGTISGTVYAPSGGGVSGTEVFACLVTGSKYDCNAASTKTTTISSSGASASYSIGGLATGKYVMFACEDLNGDNQCGDGDAYGYYTAGGQDLVPVAPPASGIDIHMTVQGGSGGGGSGGGGGGGNGSGPLFLEFHGNLRQTTTTGGFQQSTVAVDASGTTHLLYAGLSPDGNSYPVRYGECGANCESSSSWTFITLGSYGGGLGGGARMVLDGSGHPRVLWFSMADISSDGTYYYGQCDGGCTTVSNWQIVPVLTCKSADFEECNALTDAGFALDPQGHPAFFMSDLGSPYYIYCNAADCTDAGNWQNSEDLTLTFIYSTLDLAFNANGQPRAVYSGLDGANDIFGYAACDSGCDQAASWQVVPVFTLDYGTSGPFSFALTAQGQPRLVYYDGSSNSLTYAWCDSDCTAAASWSSAPTGLPAYSGADGVKLVLDSTGTPAIAFSGAPDSASVESANVAVCTAGCESANPNWNPTQIETSKDIQVPPLDPCQTGESFWQLGLEPGMALDASGGLHVSYATTSFFSCPGGQTPRGYPITNVGTMYGPLRYAELH